MATKLAASVMASAGLALAAAIHSGGAPVAAAAATSAPARAPAATTTIFTIRADIVTNPAVNRRWMGCHSDPGFVQTPRGFLANLVFASSFGTHPYLCSRGGHSEKTRDLL